MTLDPKSIAWDDAPKSLDPGAIKWDDEPSLMGPMAADAAAIRPFAAADPNAQAIAKGIAGAQDVGATVASRYTPAGLIPAGAGLLSALGVAGSEGDKLAGFPLPPPLNIAAALANNDSSKKVGQAFTNAAAPLQYEPSTEAGKLVAAPADYVFGGLGKLGDKAQSAVEQGTGSHGLGMLANTATQVIPMLLGAKAVHGGADIASAIKSATATSDANIGASMAGDLEMPSADTIRAQETATAAAPPPKVDPTAAVTAQVNNDLKTALTAPAPNSPRPAAPPVATGQGPTPPPPEVAAKLKAVTGGDPQKMAAIIQSATGGNLKPGETPANLATEAANVRTPNLEPVRQAGAPSPVADNVPGTPGQPPNPDAQGAVTPEAAARAAVLAEKPDAAPPLHPWTPVDTNADIPLAGGVIEHGAPDGGQAVGIDKRIPQFVDVDGKKIDAHEAIGVHERTEKTLMEQGLHYDDAHDLATKAENAFVAKKYGVDPEKYQSALTEHIANAKKAASNSPDIPPTLDAKPYVDGGDEGLLTPAVEQNVPRGEPPKPENLADVHSSYMAGLKDEIGWDQVGGRLLRAPLKDNEGALGEVTGRTSWVPKNRSDGNGQSGFWSSYREAEGSNALNEAQAKAALDKHANGEKLTVREKRFIDYADKQAQKYTDEYAEEHAAYQETQRQESKPEKTQPPSDYGGYAKDYTPGDEAGGFTPQERHAARLNSHLAALGDLTPEQRRLVIENHGTVETDPVMGLPTRKELVPTIEAAKQAGGGSYGEVDIRGVGSLNAHVGSNSAADPHLRAIAQIVDKHAQEAAKATGGRAVVVRKGGDELGVIAHGMDAEALHKAMARAQAEVDAYAKQHGLDKAAPAKVGGQPGVGLHFGVSEITPNHDIGSIIGEADRQVELRKKGELGYEYSGQTGKVGTEPLSGQTGRVAGSPAAGVRERPSGRTNAPQRATAEETGTETAVAEPEAVKAEPKAETQTATAESGTQVKNAAVDDQRARIGLDQLPAAEREHWQDASDEAAARIEQDPNYPKALAAEVKAKPRALTTVETMALAHDLKNLSDEHASATKDALDARDRGDAIAEAQALQRKQMAEDDMEVNHAALRVGGTPAARSMSIRNMILKDDYSVGRMMDRAKLAYGDKFNDTLKRQVQDLAEQLKQEQDKSAKLREQVNARQQEASARKAAAKMTPDEKMQARIQKQIEALQKTIDERLKACPI